MKKRFILVMVTRWAPVKCGIATYAHELVGHGLAPVLNSTYGEQGWEMHILCHKGGALEAANTQVKPILDPERDPSWPIKVMDEINRIREANPGQDLVVFFQHEFGLYNSTTDPQGWLFTKPLFECKIAGIPTVVTYHTLLVDMPPNHKVFYSHSLPLATASIVHEDIQRMGIPWNIGRVVRPQSINVIGHGAQHKAVDKEANRQKYGLDGKKVMGLIGWFSENKCIEETIRYVWPSVREKVENSLFLVAGEAREGDSQQVEYKARLIKAIQENPHKDSIRLLACSDPTTYEEILSTFDVMPLLYRDASQSGNLAHAYSHGIPVVVSALEGLHASVDASRAGETVPLGDWQEAAVKISSILNNDEYRDALSQRGKKYVEEQIGWEVTARKHLSAFHWAIQNVGN